MRVGECTRRRGGWGRAALTTTLMVVAALVVVAASPEREARAHSVALTPVPGPTLARAASLDPAQRLEAVAALQAAATPAAWNILVIMLQRDVDSRVRQAAALALGAARDPDLVDALEFSARSDLDPQVRQNAELSRRMLAPFGKRPKLATGLSVLCPGCGYFYLGQPARALAFLGGAAALIGAGLLVDENTPVDPVTRERSGGRSMPLLLGAQNLWLYGMFATYRDARLARGDEGWRYPVAREQLDDLLLAPFNPRVLKRAWVWAAVPALLAGAIGVGYLASRVTGDSLTGSVRTLGDPGGVRFFGSRYDTGPGFALGEAYNLSLYVPVGIGEEALFRGVIQAGLSETSLGLWGGWAVGSLIFGAGHILNFAGKRNGLTIGAIAVPYITLTGSYLGYLYVRTKFSLLAGTAVHFWYDFLLSTISFIADPDDQPFNVRLSIPF